MAKATNKRKESSKKDTTKQEVLIAITGINEASYHFNALLARPEVNEISYQLSYNLRFGVKEELIIFTLGVRFFYPDLVEENVAEISVENFFQVKDLNKFITTANENINPENMHLPSHVLISMVQVSISHTRALFAKNIATTRLPLLILPIQDSIKVAKQFFGDKIQ